MRPIMTLLAALLGGVAMAAPSPVYHAAGAIAGPDGSWDYARVDPSTHRLYVARGEAVTVVDLRSGKSRSLGALQRGHAVVPLPGGRLLVTSGDDGTTRFLDADDGRELANIATGKKPDAAIADAKGAHAYVMNAGSGTVSIIDVATMRVSGTIPLKPGLEFAALRGTTLFVNNEDRNEIETVDLARGRAGPPIALPGCEGPSGLALDAKHGRLISACANGKAAIVDVRAGRLTGLVEIGLGPDAVILDEARDIAFIPCGKDGVLDELSLASPAGVKRIARIRTEVGARTGALDPQSGALYLPTATFAPSQQAGGRPTPVPGSFHILVVRPS